MKKLNRYLPLIICGISVILFASYLTHAYSTAIGSLNNNYHLRLPPSYLKTSTKSTTRPVTLYLVVSYRPDRFIERIFINKDNCLKYIDYYKESHNYDYEEQTYTE